jgi:hypothetical protein
MMALLGRSPIADSIQHFASQTLQLGFEVPLVGRLDNLRRLGKILESLVRPPELQVSCCEQYEGKLHASGIFTSATRGKALSQPREAFLRLPQHGQ